MNDDKNQSGEQLFTSPPLRQFEVRRYVADWSGDQSKPRVETIVVSAHVLQHAGAKANVLMFFDYVVDPIVGPSTRLHRIINGYLDMIETTPTASQIIH